MKFYIKLATNEDLSTMSAKRNLDTTEAEDKYKMIVDNLKTEGDKKKMMVDIKTEGLEVAKNEGDKTEDMDFEETEGNKTVLTEFDTQRLKDFKIGLKLRSETFLNNRSYDAKVADSMLPGLNIDGVSTLMSQREQHLQDKKMGWGADKGKGEGEADTAKGKGMGKGEAEMTADEANMAQRLDNHAESCRNMTSNMMADIAYAATTAAALLDQDADKAYDSWTTDKYCPHCHKEVTIAIDNMGMAWFDKSNHESQAEEAQTDLEEVKRKENMQVWAEETQRHLCDTTEAKRKENMQDKGDKGWIQGDNMELEGDNAGNAGPAQSSGE